jgi:nickel-dependent lactate racemase
VRTRISISPTNRPLEFPEGKLLADFSRPPTSGHSASIRDVLNAPLGYPPVTRAVVPGDHVTIAVDPETPQWSLVVREIAEQLIEAGSNASDITVLLAAREQPEGRSRVREALPASWGEQVQVVVHEPENEATHMYLAATKEGRAVYLNRAIGDADVVIPVGLARQASSFDYRGVHGAWFPTFSNLETQIRYQSPGNLEWKTHQRRRREETEEAAWLLGVQFIVQVMPGPAGSIGQIWCGEAQQVARAVEAASGEMWRREVDRPAELVIAVLDNESPSWEDVARALAMAVRVVAEDGAIALWTNLSIEPGPALKALADLDVSEEELRVSLLKHRSADAVAAKVIADCRQRCRIYLHSALDDAVVEPHGLAPLHSIEELQRLIDQHATCLVIGSAQYAGVQLRQVVEA